MIWRIASLAFYLAPFLVGLGRWRRDRQSAASPQLVFFVNVLLGWTGIGWLVAWWLAFRRTPLPTLSEGGWVGPLPDRPIWSDDPREPGPAPGPVPAWNQPTGSNWHDPGPSKATCPTCNGTGQMQCPRCWGRGSWWVPPTTATGSGHQEQCRYCLGDGKVQCGGPGPHP